MCTHTLWIASSTATPTIYDPRNGTNVTDFIIQPREFESRMLQSKNLGKIFIKHLMYIPELNEVVVITNRKGIARWRFNLSANVSTLHGHSDVVEALAFSMQFRVILTDPTII